MIEIRMLAWSVLLGLAHILVAGVLSAGQRGLGWHAGNRDAPAKELTGPAARAARASANFLETFVFFAAALLAVVVTNKTTEHTALGAQVYFWARAAYLPIYIAGIPYLRSVVWIAAFWGALQLVEALL